MQKPKLKSKKPLNNLNDFFVFWSGLLDGAVYQRGRLIQT